MLIQFTVGNFHSFKEPVTLSMVATKLKAVDSRIDENNTILVNDDLSLLTSAAIYGANASGKSNLIAALRFMRNFVLSSSRDTEATEAIDIDNFKLSTETAGKPSFFEAIFIEQDIQYRYGFEVDQEKVISEWLFRVPKNREARLFVRENNNIEYSRSFKEGKGLENKTRPNALFLSVVAQFNGTIAMTVLLWFKKLGIISGLNDAGYRNFTIGKFDNTDFRQKILQLVKSLDLGIMDVRVDKSADVKIHAAPVLTISIESSEEISESVQRKLEKVFGPASVQPMSIQTVHTTFKEDGSPDSLETFDLGLHESEGTKKLFFLTGPIIDTLANGNLLVIDEMEARLHPLITRDLIRLFNSMESNRNRAQLIFTTHDTNLLSNKCFRRDQIWFVEKDDLNASHLYSLAEIKLDENKVRNDASFEDDYIQGRYGAIPFLGGVRKIFLEGNQGHAEK
jgi:AAA15 family ATPase/GTPase